MKDSEYDVLSFSETWLTNTIYDSELCMNGKYTIFRKDRNPLSTGKNVDGGVMVKDSYETQRIPEFETNDENVWIKFSTDRKNWTYLCVVYFPPDAKTNVFKYFFDKVSYREVMNCNLIISGDFNCLDLMSSLIKNSNANLMGLRLFINVLGLTQRNYVENLNVKVLDLVLTNIDGISINRAPKDSLILKKPTPSN